MGTSLAALELGRDPTIVDGSSVQHAKPAPDLLLATADALGQRPAGCWCIGDSTWDAIAAGKLDIPTLAVRTGGFSPEELQEAGATQVYDSLVALRQHLDDTPLKAVQP